MKSNREKISLLGKRTIAVVGLSALTMVVTAGVTNAAEKSLIDDESYDPENDHYKRLMVNDAQIKFIAEKAKAATSDIQKPDAAPLSMLRISETERRVTTAPIELVEPKVGIVEPPTRIEASPPPPSSKKPDGSIELATPALFEAPMQIEASPPPTKVPAAVVPTPPAEGAPPAAPAIEQAPAAPTPEVIVDPALAGETLWTTAQLEKVKANLGVYLEVQNETGVPWEVMAALHVREYGLRVENPSNGQGIYQLYSSGKYFAPGPVSTEEFKYQTILAANFMIEKAKDNRRVSGPLNLTFPDKIKDTLFSYNGIADQYIQQAIDQGYDLWAEGSPYVMNMADDKRNSDKNPGWGQILTDNGPLGKANKAPGAWPLIEGLVKINKISHEQAAKRAADAAAKTAATAAAEEEAKRAAGGLLVGWPTTGEDAMDLFNQCDPRWGNILSPNGMRACDISCGPTNVAMAVKVLKPEVVITPKETIDFANANKMWFTPVGGARDSGGITFDGMIQLASNWGVKGNQMGAGAIKRFEAYKQILEDGGVIIAAGSGPLPFVQPNVGAHFVMIRGITPDGKFLVADPYPKTPDTNTVAWDANQIMQSTFGAVVLYN